MTDFALWGTFVNTGAVILGSLVGLVIKFFLGRAARKIECEGPDPLGEEKRPSRLAYLPVAVQHSLGLCAIVIGLLGTFDFESGYKLNVLVAIL